MARREGNFCCLYGRRRCGKSRLLHEALSGRRAVYYVADEREPPLQRAALAGMCRSLLPGFADVSYPDWHSLLDRWWREAPAGAVLALDEFPYLVKQSRELPSLLQRQIDQHPSQNVRLVLCGSSQRMMQGLFLDAAAPLYGRAREIIHVKPLRAGWINRALKVKTAPDALEAYAVWGGVPRYWELAAEYEDTWSAVHELVLDPMGVLHDEPNRLLLDDIRDTAQAASILSLIGAGCHRLSEIAARLGKPATSLTRPLTRLMDLGYVHREHPFGESPRSSKKTHYQIADPFLLFWFCSVQPNRSRLESSMHKQGAADIRRSFSGHVAHVWESLAREAVPSLALGNTSWGPSRRWWGAGKNRQPLECDLVAESFDGKSLLVGEVKLRLSATKRRRTEQTLQSKIDQLPFTSRYRQVVPAIFTDVMDNRSKRSGGITYVSVAKVLQALK